MELTVGFIILLLVIWAAANKISNAISDSKKDSNPLGSNPKCCSSPNCYCEDPKECICLAWDHSK
mgnify:CR=1 FL=1